MDFILEDNKYFLFLSSLRHRLNNSIVFGYDKICRPRTDHILTFVEIFARQSIADELHIFGGEIWIFPQSRRWAWESIAGAYTRIT